MSNYKNITPVQVKEKLDRGDLFRLIDVREPNEYAHARIEGAQLIVAEGVRQAEHRPPVADLGEDLPGRRTADLLGR